MQTEKDARRSVRRVVLAWRVLVAEPERDPCAVRPLGGGEELHGSRRTQLARRAAALDRSASTRRSTPAARER